MKFTSVTLVALLAGVGTTQTEHSGSVSMYLVIREDKAFAIILDMLVCA